MAPPSSLRSVPRAHYPVRRGAGGAGSVASSLVSRFTQLILAAALLAPPLLLAQTAPDRSAERAARRAQQQLQAAQQQASQAEADKAKALAQVGETEKQLKAREAAARSAQAASKLLADKLKAAEDSNKQLTARIAELEKAVADQRSGGEQALAAKDRELAQAAAAIKAKESERLDWQQRFGQQVRLVTECSGKNERLLHLNAELLNRWRDKGVVEALRQREPLLGLGDVEMFNLVQQYRDKADSERFTPQLDNNGKP